MSLEDVKMQVEKVRSVLCLVSPFLASLIRKARIITASLGYNVGAGVDASNNLVINMDVWGRFGWKEIFYILSHEVMHLAFRHLKRRGMREPVRWNIAADAVVARRGKRQSI